MAGKKLNLIGSQLHILRKKKSLSQKELAARCTIVGFRIEWDTISKIERQIRTVSDLEMVLLADALRVKVDLLVPKERLDWVKDTRLPHVTNDDD